VWGGPPTESGESIASGGWPCAQGPRAYDAGMVFGNLPTDLPPLRAACERIKSRAGQSMTAGPWASGSMAALAEHGVLAGFIPADQGGRVTDEADRLAALASVATACLTTALAASQWAAAVRIITSGDAASRTALLPPLAHGETFTTVGLSQLTTSRQHLGRPALVASRTDRGWRLDGLCPWVTGADACDTIVTGAATDEGSLFFVVPTDAAGLRIDPPLEMLALSGSRTSAVRFTGVRPTHSIAPPETHAARAGGLATTALALGTARAAIELLASEAARRDGLEPIAAGLSAELADLFGQLIRAAQAGITADARDVLRGAANGLVLRAAQAALTASKGAGFVSGHPAERLVRESLFFLVWSCPQSVSTAMLCELAGVA
jgi:alkylation response protein AidB-like acyl-CoA dehydrogenase